ncbi:MAG TPA: histidine--tRNA ligase [Thermomicrobiales bacterium]|jgi:histidyl-tRNA synthetase|nr:histidine--tRNA ligase [Thermomicrobiales bacterium]
MTDAPVSPARIKPRILSGFRDFLPAQMLLRQEIIGRFRGIFENHGYEPIETPILEHLDILTGKAGENEKLMYHFSDHGDRRVGMRYDLTVPFSRVLAMHQNELVMPFKRYHIGPVWRAEKSQRGRFREFWQCDADIAGSPSMLADAEGISILTEAIAAVGLPNAVVRVNHRHLLAAIARSTGAAEGEVGNVIRTIDRLDKIGADKVAQQLVDGGLPRDGASRLMGLITARGRADTILSQVTSEIGQSEDVATAVADLSAVFDALAVLGVPEGSAIVDLSLARGLDYYTGPVVEATVEQPAIGSIAGGGRYDGLVSSFSSRPMPATGVSLGIERIIEVVSEFGLIQAPTTTAEVFVASFRDGLTEAARLSTMLRSAGIRTDLSLLGERSLGEQFKYASRKGIRLAVFQGSDEAAAGLVAVKDLVGGDQQSHPVANLIEIIRRQLAGSPQE